MNEYKTAWDTRTELECLFGGPEYKINWRDAQHDHNRIRKLVVENEWLRRELEEAFSEGFEAAGGNIDSAKHDLAWRRSDARKALEDEA